MKSLSNAWALFRTRLILWWGVVKESDIVLLLYVILTSPLWLPLGLLEYIYLWVVWLHMINNQPSRDLLRPTDIEMRIEERRLRDAVRTLPTLRHRALTLRHSITENMTIPSVSKIEEVAPEEKTLNKEGKKKIDVQSGDSKQVTKDQLGTSIFYRLPFEVREIIWAYAVGRHHIHIVKRRGRLGNVYCPADDPTDVKRRDVCLHSRDWNGFYRPTAWPVDVRPLSIIGSCRQIYSETIDFLYSLNTFSFDDQDTLLSFFENLLLHRKKLVSSVHIHFNLTRSSRPYWQEQIYEPLNNNLATWSRCFRTLNTLPNLQSLQLTIPMLISDLPSLNVSFINDFLSSLNEVKVKRHFSINWPEQNLMSASFQANHPSNVWHTRLPRDPNFKVRRFHKVDRGKLLAFFLPFNIRCLHCYSTTILRKCTRGHAESVTIRNDGEWGEYLVRRRQSLIEPKTTHYWTFHTECGGWMEFQYDWATSRWSVTQGVEQISDEEAESYFAQSERNQRKLDNPHELMQGLSVFDDRDDRYGNTMDTPTKEMLYKNVGWTKT